MAEVAVNVIAHVANVVIDDAQCCWRCRRVLWRKDSCFKVWEGGSHVLEFPDRNTLIRGPHILPPNFALCEPPAR